MALFYQHNINENTKLGIWRIEEPEAFYLEKVPLKKGVSHPYKRLQHLAGRFLLPTLYEDFPLEEILVADTRKPFLESEQYHFSISHGGNFAAAIVSSKSRVGVDIELVSPRIIAISHKFLDHDEKVFLNDWIHLTKMHLELSTVLWSAKEAIYKWYGHGELDFRRHMQLNGPITFKADETIVLPFMFRKEAPIALTVEARIFDQLALAWVMTQG
ncbi:4'-phosphopantetheinyl transferase family protein [Longitalea arenae]|uniref:4'-phosphopantetheinyl transferase family protein n=1 Tax=Longitalea arenae TaxID=2812558 RepID=UPI001968443D